MAIIYLNSDDTLSWEGSAGPVEVDGLDGSDRLTGGLGGDTLTGGDGRDFLAGGLGDDIQSLHGAKTGRTIG